MPTPPLSSVLLVDDDPTTNYLNQLLLGTTMQVARQVLIAENGHEALAILAGAAAGPQLILLDMNMPVMNGREFLEAYVHLPAAQRRGIVVVMLTTSLHEQDQLVAQRLPIADFVSKPLTRAKVNELLVKYFAEDSKQEQVGE